MLSFKQFISEEEPQSNHEGIVRGVYGDGEHHYAVHKMIQNLGDRKPKMMKIDDIISSNRGLETKEGNFARNIENPSKDFHARTMRADTRYPILMHHDGSIIDGSHRVARLKWQGETHIPVHVMSDDDLHKAKINSHEELEKYSAVK